MPPVTRRSSSRSRRNQTRTRNNNNVRRPAPPPPRRRTRTTTTTVNDISTSNRRRTRTNKVTIPKTTTTNSKQNDDTEDRSCSSSTSSSSPSSSSSSSDTSSHQHHRHRRRRSSRGHSCLAELARDIVEHCKRVVFITGAGVSVASGVRPFRGQSGVWTEHIYTQSTREAFRRDPLAWYNTFWLPCLCDLPSPCQPNPAHHAIQCLLQRYPYHLRMITQNVDGLFAKACTGTLGASPSLSASGFSSNQNSTIEAHGRLGLFKCIPEEDSESDTDSDTDDEDERPVHLGHRRKWRESTRSNKCMYRQKQSLTADQIEPPHIRQSLKEGKGPLSDPPSCPCCGNIVAPQALLFDEGYHSHDYYEFQKMEEWLAEAEVIVFVGTSFAVRLPEATLDHARSTGIPVYNFNTIDMLEPSSSLNASNIRGKAEVTLPLLLEEVDELQNNLDHPDPSTTTKQSASLSSSLEASTTTRPPRLRRSSRKRRPKYDFP